MEEHLIFFIDFLGFGDAVLNWPDERLNQVGDLLKQISQMRGDTFYAEQPTDNGKRFTHRPAITTFSDHMVISFRVEDLKKPWAENSGEVKDLFALPLSIMQQTIGNLAMGALRLGLLIRGGITVGPLYHQNGVVIGKAMIEAYNLETKVASYPRIAISKKVYSKVLQTPRESLILKDTDGISHYNHFTYLILANDGHNTVEQAFNPYAANYELAMKLIDENIEQFEQAEDWNKLSKWSWMKKAMEERRAKLNDALFKERPTARKDSA